MKVAIGLEYHGAAFFGWQSQAGGNTVQDVVEEALSWVADEPVRVHAAGRTDSGVHAALMPAHFSSTRRRQPSAWVSGANARLPPTVRVLWSKAVADSFGARRTAVARHYGYVLTQRAERPALLASLSGFCHVPLDVAAMRRAAGALVGEHDFSAFRASACQARTPVRRLLRVDIRQEGEFVFFHFCGDGFLHHMVRNVVGSLLAVGRGRQPPEWLGELLARRDRRLAAPTASAAGLYFCGAEYPAHFKLPPTLRFPRLVAPVS